MKILFVVEHFPCVSETFVLNQITGLIDLGHDIEIYALGEPVLSAVHPDVEKYGLIDRCWRKCKIPSNKLLRVMKAIMMLLIHGWRAPVPLLKSLDIRKYSHQAASLYLFYSALPFLLKNRRFYFDAIHCHFGDKGVLAQNWREIGLIDKPLSVVFHAHEMCMQSEDEYKILYGPLLSSDALILPISNYWKQLLLSWGASPERVKVHHMGVDCNKIAFNPKPYKPGEKLCILTVARIAESKGIEYGIRAIAELKKDYPNIQYTIVGDGPLKISLQKLSHELGLDDTVTFVGAKSQNEVSEYLANSHVFLSPHVTARNGIKEGIPVAIMEAMAAGVLVITTRHSGIPELVEDGDTGLLADEKDIEGLLIHLKCVAHNPTSWEGVQVNARNKMERDFNIDVLNTNLSNLLKRNTSSYIK